MMCSTFTHLLYNHLSGAGAEQPSEVCEVVRRASCGAFLTQGTVQPSVPAYLIGAVLLMERTKHTLPSNE